MSEGRNLAEQLKELNTTEKVSLLLFVMMIIFIIGKVFDWW